MPLTSAGARDMVPRNMRTLFVAHPSKILGGCVPRASFHCSSRAMGEAYPPTPAGIQSGHEHRTAVYEEHEVKDDGGYLATMKSDKTTYANATGKGHIENFYAGKSVLMIGASGFVGKCVLDKLLRDAPELNKMFVMARAKKDKTPMDRFKTEIAPSRALERLRTGAKPDWETFMAEKLQAVGGDINTDGMGLSAEDLTMITENVDIIINCAASINFTERVDIIMNTNTKGPMRILDLASKCKKPITYIHMSTAYVGSWNPSGTKVLEELPKVNIDPEVLLEQLKTMTPEEITKKTPEWIGTHQNTYTFSKALGETMLERHRGKTAVGIVRPSIIVNAFSDPEPGWIENLSGASAVALFSNLGRCPVVEGQLHTTLDLIPVDFVTNATIAAAWDVTELHKEKTDGTSGFRIYHSTSSCLNPVTPLDCSNGMTRFQRKFPSRKAMFRPTMRIVGSYPVFKVVLFSKLFEWGWKAVAKRKYPFKKIMTQLVKAYYTTSLLRGFFLYFASNEWFYDASNVVKMDAKLMDVDKKVFPVNPQRFDWGPYWEEMNAGLLQFVLKEDILERRAKFNAQKKYKEEVMAKRKLEGNTAKA